MPLQDFLDFTVNGNVCVLESVDRVSGAGNSTEVKIAADMVILVKRREDPFGLSAIETEIGECRGTPVIARDGQIFFDDFAKVHLFRSTSFSLCVFDLALPNSRLRDRTIRAVRPFFARVRRNSKEHRLKPVLRTSNPQIRA